jgi:hypothetical protein
MALLGGIWASLALAQPATVWRCGPEGRLYSDRPCTGVGQPVAVADPRLPQERAEGRAIAEREAALAEQLRAERLEREMASPTIAATPSRTIDWNSPTVAEQAFGPRSGGWHPDAKHRAGPHAGRGRASPYDLSDVLQRRPAYDTSVRPSPRGPARGG